LICVVRETFLQNFASVMQRSDREMHLINKQTIPLDLQELIRQCLSDNPDAQKLLFEKFVTPMARVCTRYLHDRDMAQDAMMEGFMKVFNQLRRFEYQGEHSLAMWIRKIMVNECLMKLRKDRSRFFMDIADLHLEKHELTADHFSTADILALVESLPIGYRTVFNLYAVDGYSHQEIATMLNITESASRSQLTHARARLKELLRKNGWT
jgi:RNA polymerase sigma factor (sigma-70 family)